jgi:RNA recognition motif-containing protein
LVKSLYVGNLPWGITRDELLETFCAHAPVISARVITDPVTRRSQGFGFVEVEDNDAPKVIKAMHGFMLAGRALIVNEARHKPQGRSIELGKSVEEGKNI